MSYGDYPSTMLRTGPSTMLRAGVEQLTYLLFIKMADERTKPPYNQPSQIPDKYSWPSLLKKDGDDLFDHYRRLLEELGKGKGMLGLIFNRSQNKFQGPAKLRCLIVVLIDKEDWAAMGYPLGAG
jgi:type I restriction enzyme M protein